MDLYIMDLYIYVNNSNQMLRSCSQELWISNTQKSIRFMTELPDLLDWHCNFQVLFIERKVICRSALASPLTVMQNQFLACALHMIGTRMAGISMG